MSCCHALSETKEMRWVCLCSVANTDSYGETKLYSRLFFTSNIMELHIAPTASSPRPLSIEPILATLISFPFKMMKLGPCLQEGARLYLDRRGNRPLLG